MDVAVVLNELIDELEEVKNQIMAPYTNNDKIDFIPTLYAGESIGIETAIKYIKLKLEAIDEKR